MVKGEPFPDVDMPRMYPQQSVPDHVILMSFNGDSQAVAFDEWWEAEGSILFNRWFKERSDADA